MLAKTKMARWEAMTRLLSKTSGQPALRRELLWKTKAVCRESPLEVAIHLFPTVGYQTAIGLLLRH